MLPANYRVVAAVYHGNYNNSDDGTGLRHRCVNWVCLFSISGKLDTRSPSTSHCPYLCLWTTVTSTKREQGNFQTQGSHFFPILVPKIFGMIQMHYQLFKNRLEEPVLVMVSKWSFCSRVNFNHASHGYMWSEIDAYFKRKIINIHTLLLSCRPQ